MRIAAAALAAALLCAPAQAAMFDLTASTPVTYVAAGSEPGGPREVSPGAILSLEMRLEEGFASGIVDVTAKISDGAGMPLDWSGGMDLSFSALDDMPIDAAAIADPTFLGPGSADLTPGTYDLLLLAGAFVPDPGLSGPYDDALVEIWIFAPDDRVAADGPAALRISDFDPGWYAYAMVLNAEHDGSAGFLWALPERLEAGGGPALFALSTVPAPAALALLPAALAGLGGLARLRRGA